MTTTVRKSYQMTLKLKKAKKDKIMSYIANNNDITLFDAYMQKDKFEETIYVIVLRFKRPIDIFNLGENYAK